MKTMRHIPDNHAFTGIWYKSYPSGRIQSAYYYTNGKNAQNLPGRMPATIWLFERQRLPFHQSGRPFLISFQLFYRLGKMMSTIVPFVACIIHTTVADAKSWWVLYQMRTKRWRLQLLLLLREWSVYLQCVFRMWKRPLHLLFPMPRLWTRSLHLLSDCRNFPCTCCPNCGNDPCICDDENTEPDNPDDCNGPKCPECGGLIMDGITTRACFLSNMWWKKMSGLWEKTL